ncbi:glycosyltransferase family 9 protein [bacterium]|nr:glycosyltransferase family 9 protein [bacterium]
MKQVIKNVIKFVLFGFIDIIVIFSRNKRMESKTILLVRLDAIGDYILFRNFIEAIKEDEKYKDYTITLCGNVVWKELAEYFDGTLISKFIWIDRIKFNKNIFYRYRRLKKISSVGYEIAIQPTYSREFFFGDNIIKVANAKEKIGSCGDLANITPWQKRISDQYYIKLIPAKNEIMFEFYRNKEFLETLLSKKIHLTKPELKNIPSIKKSELPQNYAILFISASSKFRRWNYENFAIVGKYLRKNHGFNIVICGTDMDYNDGEKITMEIEDAVNLCGKTTILEIMNIIHTSKIIISNETSAPHIAISCGVKCVVVFNGNHFGRFTPYPKEITNNYYIAYHPQIKSKLEKYKKISNGRAYVSKLDINEISPDRVIKEIDKALSVIYNNKFP